MGRTVSRHCEPKHYFTLAEQDNVTYNLIQGNVFTMGKYVHYQGWVSTILCGPKLTTRFKPNPYLDN